MFHQESAKAQLLPAIVIAGTTVSLGVVRALGTMGVPVIVLHYADKDISYLSRFVQFHMRVPHPEQNEEEFLHALSQLADRYGGGIVMPVSDQAIVAVSRNKASLERDFLVACSKWEIAKLFIDKKYTYELADQCGVPAPRTMVPRSIEELSTYCKEMEFPCLMKPSTGHRFVEKFGPKMIKANSLEEAISAYQMATDAGLEIMLQELIPGPDTNVVNYNAYIVDGKPAVEVTAVHFRNGPPWRGSPRVALSKSIQNVIEPGRRILRAIGYSGFACTEFKLDPRDDVYKLMEVNGRHNLSTLLSVRSGANFPWFEYRHMAFGEVPQQPEIQEGIYWIDLIRDLGHSMKNFGREGYSVSQYLRPYLGPHVFAIWDMRDLSPFRGRLHSLFRNGFRAISSGH